MFRYKSNRICNLKIIKRKIKLRIWYSGGCPVGTWPYRFSAGTGRCHSTVTGSDSKCWQV